MPVKTQVLAPAYFDTFACTGSACEDHCCKGWSITIDKSTYLKYKKIKDPILAEKVAKAVRRIKGEMANDANYAQFILSEKTGACLFQLEDGLCEIHAKLGPGMLCTTCQVYPRLNNMVNPELLENSLSMSCPEAVRAALLNPEPMAFQLTEKEIDPASTIGKHRVVLAMQDKDPDKPMAHVWIIRDACIDLMQNRQYSLSERMMLVGVMLKKLDELEAQDKCRDMPTTAALYVAAAQSGKLAGIEDKFTFTEEMRANVATALFAIMMHYRKTNENAYAPFNTFWQRFLEKNRGKEIEAQDNNGQYAMALAMQQFVDANVAARWQSIQAKQGYVLENYLVNYIFSAIFPYTFRNQEVGLYHHFILLAEQFALLRILLCCNNGGEEVPIQPLVKTITCMAQMNQHNRDVTQIIKTYQANQMDDLAHIAVLLQ